MFKLNSSYLAKAFDPTHELVEAMLKTITGVEFDTMIGRGTSGLLVVPLLARALDKHFAIVRKPNDASHKETDIEGTIGDRWIFVDDFVSTGNTRARVKEAVTEAQRYHQFKTEFVGTYEYHFQRFSLEVGPSRSADGSQSTCSFGCCKY